MLVSAFIATLLTVLKFVASATQDCPKGQIRDLNGKCVKRFVPPKRQSCEEPQIRFGNFEVESGGRIVYMWCEEGWKLTTGVEEEHAMCVLGKWDRWIPMCVRPGCEMPDSNDLERRNKVTFVEEIKGSLLRFSCIDEGKNTMITNSSLYDVSVIACDGENWNSTAPICREKVVEERATENSQIKISTASSASATNYIPMQIALLTLVSTKFFEAFLS